MEAFVQSGMQHAKLDHLHLMELNTVRPLLPATMDHVYRMEMASAQVKKMSQSSTADRSMLGSSMHY